MSNLSDAVGTEHPPAVGDVRIVSLVPSLTELLFDLGLGPRVVGRTHFCVHPADRVAEVKSVGGTKKISMRKLVELAPTHVILNIDENTEAMGQAIAATVPNVIVTHPIEPQDNVAVYELLGSVFGREKEANGLRTRFSEAFASLVDAAQDWPSQRVLYLIWKDPWMTVSHDTYVSRLLALAGWHTVGHDDSVRFPEVEIDEDLLAGTDLVLFSSEPYAFKPEDIMAFATDNAFGSARLLPIDGEMTSWYGSRAVMGLTYLRRFATVLLDA